MQSTQHVPPQSKTPFDNRSIKSGKDKRAHPHLEQDSVAAEELEALHGVRVHRDDGVVVIGGLVDHQPVRRLLPLEDRRREILLPLPAPHHTPQHSTTVSRQSPRKTLLCTVPEAATTTTETETDRSPRRGRADRGRGTHGSEASEDDGSPWLAMAAEFDEAVGAVAETPREREARRRQIFAGAWLGSGAPTEEGTPGDYSAFYSFYFLLGAGVPFRRLGVGTHLCTCRARFVGRVRSMTCGAEDFVPT